MTVFNAAAFQRHAWVAFGIKPICMLCGSVSRKPTRPVFLFKFWVMLFCHIERAEENSTGRSCILLVESVQAESVLV